jgi:hypothetical protein
MSKSILRKYSYLELANTHFQPLAEPILDKQTFHNAIKTLSSSLKKT